MRVYLPAELRRYFDIAWGILPYPVQRELKPFIVTVRSADSLMGLKIKCRDGVEVMSEEEGGGWCVYDPSANEAFIILRNNLQSREISAVYTGLHELAHAYEYLQDDSLAVNRLSERSEVAAAAQAASWASRDTQKQYPLAFEVVKMALFDANINAEKWPTEILRQFVLDELKSWQTSDIDKGD